MKISFKILIALGLLISLKLFAYPAVVYNFDEAGNRITSRVVNMKQSIETPPEEQKVAGFSIKVYPNPTADILKVEIEGLQKDSRVKIEMFDLKGAKLYSNETNNNRYDIDLSQRTTGVYILNIYIDDKTTYWKIVISPIPSLSAIA